MKKLLPALFLVFNYFMINAQIDKDSLLIRLEGEYSGTDTLSILDSDSLFVVSFLNEDNAEIFLLGFYLEDSTLSYYSEGMDTRFYKQEGLSSAKWYNNELITYSNFGKGLQFEKWEKLPEGGTKHLERDSLGFGTSSIYSSDGTLLKIVNIFFISSSFTENSLRMSLRVCPLFTE